jgi:hypothetical protein
MAYCLQVGDPIVVVNDMDIPFYDVLTVPAPLNGFQCHDGNPISKQLMSE